MSKHLKKKELIDLSKKAIQYFENIRNKKYINIRNLKTFFKLYNMEYLEMRIKTFLMMNTPIIGRIMFNIRAKIHQVYHHK